MTGGALRIVRLRTAVNGGSALHRSYRELARHDGCKVDPMPPYAALSATVAISGDGVRHRRCDY